MIGYLWEKSESWFFLYSKVNLDNFKGNIEIQSIEIMEDNIEEYLHNDMVWRICWTD